MARPKKETIDYFPHYCDHGKTVFIIQSQFGNDGYAFFYKLLERLGKVKGHFIDCRNPEEWEFLQAKTNISGDLAENILNKLSSMGKIDAELWSVRVIWMQAFIDSIADVYKNRRVEIPLKPNFNDQKQQECVVSTDQNPQSKVNKSKVNKNPPYSPQKINFENNRFTDIPDALMEKWREVAPGINIGDEIKKAELWLLANPQKRRSRYNSFLSTWMVRAQDHFIKYGGNGNGSGNTRPGYSGSTGTAHAKTGNAQSDGTPWPADREY